jgi:hypothetical protein
MPNPGDVVGFFSAPANKHKYHVCVGQAGKYLFLNSPKATAYPGDFRVNSAHVPLPPTPQGYSIISCTLLTTVSEAQFRRLNGRVLGRLPVQVLKDLIKFVETCGTLSEEDQNAIIDGLADWL